MGSNDRAFADDRVVEYRRSHADQAAILDRTSMNDGAMPNRDIFADCRGIHAVACMYEYVLLQIGATTDRDLLDITSKDDVKEYRYVISD
jgi:hypothetical protein